jgi:hypothetical protein
VEEHTMVSEFAEPAQPRSKGTVILIVLLATFPLLALLVWQQGRVIDNQRVLIQQLFGDSQELNAMRIRERQNQSKPAATVPDTTAKADHPAAAAPATPAAPARKHTKRTQPEKPSAPQEYPASRPVPTRLAI